MFYMMTKGQEKNWVYKALSTDTQKEDYFNKSIKNSKTFGVSRGYRSFKESTTSKPEDVLPSFEDVPLR